MGYRKNHNELYKNRNINKYKQQTYKEYLDSMTMQSLIDKLNIWTETVKELTILLSRLTIGCEPGQVSALQFINMVKQANYSIDTLTNIDNGYQQSPIHGGTQQISQEILKNLKQTDFQIIYNHAVFKVDQSDGHCVVHYAERLKTDPDDDKI